MVWDPSFLQRLEAVIEEKHPENLCVDVVLPIMKGEKNQKCVGKVTGLECDWGEYHQIEGESEMGDVYEYQKNGQGSRAAGTIA